MRSKLLSAIPSLRYGCSTRADGSMRVETRDDLHMAERVKFLRALGVTFEQTAGCRLVHGARVQEVPTSEKRSLFYDQTDGLYTLDTSRMLTVTGADCFPIFAIDPVTRVTGLCHAGWQGTLKGVLPELLLKMTTKLHCQMERIRVVLGPGIHACHYEVKMDVWSKFQAEDLEKQDGKTFLDLPKILMRQAAELGLLEEHIEDVAICTFCDERYFSYRRDKPRKVDAQMAYLGWKL